MNASQVNPHRILVINCGSSSVKFSLFSDGQVPVASGLAECINTPDARLKIKIGDTQKTLGLRDMSHAGAMSELVGQLRQACLLDSPLMAVGHRVVHGGETFKTSVVVNHAVLQGLECCTHLAPLHNPANLLGIKTLATLFPDVPQVTVFDTAFHQTMPRAAYLYALPYEHYEKLGVRRYGFHGTSVRYVAQQTQQQFNLPPDDHCLLVAHLGNGCSATAVKNGQSIDTTMGLTPLEGLVMGTRCGDVDPSLHEFLAAELNLDLAGVTNLLNKESGLLGLSGLSNDMRTLCRAAKEGHQQAELAIEVFCYRLARQLCALAMSLGRVDGLVFTGGIGENAVDVRHRVIKNLGLLSIEEDPARNLVAGIHDNGLISADSSAVWSAVINTDEEWMIAQDCLALVGPV